MEFRDWLPHATDLQETIWNTKYRFENETFDDAENPEDLVKQMVELYIKEEPWAEVVFGEV
jgi:hypothetical protein